MLQKAIVFVGVTRGVRYRTDPIQIDLHINNEVVHALRAYNEWLRETVYYQQQRWWWRVATATTSAKRWICVATARNASRLDFEYKLCKWHSTRERFGKCFVCFYFDLTIRYGARKSKISVDCVAIREQFRNKINRPNYVDGGRQFRPAMIR